MNLLIALPMVDVLHHPQSQGEPSSAHVLRAHGDQTSYRREIFLKKRWSAERLDALRDEATAWTDAFAERNALV